MRWAETSEEISAGAPRFCRLLLLLQRCFEEWRRDVPDRETYYEIVINLP